MSKSSPPLHVPVLLDHVLEILHPHPGSIIVDCTVGLGGHASELLKRIGKKGRLIGIDFDPASLERARVRLAEVGPNFILHRGNFAGLPQALAVAGAGRADAVLADLGVSSPQIDDAARGFSYLRDGPLDMRMDPTRGRTAADLVNTAHSVDSSGTITYTAEAKVNRVTAAVLNVYFDTDAFKGGASLGYITSKIETAPLLPL